MIEGEIDPRDLRELYFDLDALQVEELMEGELAPFAKAVGMHAGRYPDPVPDSDYIRTGNLSRSWYTKLLSRVSVEVGNLAVYAGYVHDIDDQVPWHGEHGWRRLQEDAEKTIVSFMRRMMEKIERIWTL
jgi:hypothetical protein